MLRLAIFATLALATTIGVAGAQSDEPNDGPPTCPVDRVCVTYENADGSIDTFALDPDEGVYQEIVVEEQTITTLTLSGPAPDRIRVTLAGYLENGDAYDLVKEHTELRAGIYADANLGESFGLTELR
jgi:hypothetical protein